MTIGELKENATKLIEEYSSQGINYTSDADIQNKMMFAINSVVGEIAKIKAIKKSVTYRPQKTFTLPEGFTFIDIKVREVPLSEGVDYEVNGQKYIIYSTENFVFSYVDNKGIKHERDFSAGETVVELPNDLQTLTDVRVENRSIGAYWEYGGKITVLSRKPFEVRYDAKPPKYTNETPNTTELPFDDTICMVMPYGIGKIVLMVTGQSNDATELEQKYYQYLQEMTVTANKVKPKITIWRA